jgi:translation elongation factor P/translation initiation factor 5A
MANTQVKQLQPNVGKIKADFSNNEELIKRLSIEDSPFEVITKDGASFGVMGNYRLTSKSTDAESVKSELEKITWNRVIQVVMILNELKEKINIKKEDKV